ncbi:MAG: NAD(P)/FAD-dependent oxidoreductase [Veillonellales bacterium]
MLKETYDAAVVGAGPAGSTAARILAQAGLAVLLVDQVNAVGAKVQCAEFVPRILKQHAAIRPQDIAQPIDGMKTFIQGVLANQIKAPGYILNRCLWDKYLADSAVQAGAHLSLGTRAVHWQDNQLILQSGSKQWTVNCRLLVGCDGPRSAVAGWLGNPRQETSVALQYEMTLTQPMKNVEVHFAPWLYGGYAWVFPKGKYANVGLAAHPSCRGKLEGWLNRFCQTIAAKQIITDCTIHTRTAGLIPAGGLAARLAGDGLLLAGDAAGCAHPITGAGIMAAVRSGKLAAGVIQRYFPNQAEKIAAEYTEALQEEFGIYLTKARQAIVRRDEAWTAGERPFSDVIHHSWISFSEYYQR